MPALIVFLIFLLALVLSVPIGISMVLGAASPIVLLGKGGSVTQLLNNTFSGANSTPILALPLFILGGVIMAEGGISQRLFRLFACLVGRFRGGIPCAVVLTCLFYGAVSGSGPATAAAVGTMCIPFLVSLGYDRGWSAGLVAVAGGLGVIIPPSIPAVLYSLATGISTGELFRAGILPGVLIGLFLMVTCIVEAPRRGENPQRIAAELENWRSLGFARLFLESLPALLCPVIVLGGIYTGFVTPTEAACLSVFYALAVSLLIYRSLTLRDLPALLRKAVGSYAGLAFLLAFATAFGRVLALTRATTAVTAFLTSHFTSPAALLGVLVLLFLLLGMVMDTGPAIVILAPVLLPAAETLGIDPVHFGIVLVCCLSIGLATPPFGLNLFVAAGISREAPMALARKALPFLLSFLAALLMVTYLPSLCLLF